MKKVKFALTAVMLVVALLVPMAVSAASPVSGPVAVIGVPEGVEPLYSSTTAAATNQMVSAALAAGVSGEFQMSFDFTLALNGATYQPDGSVLVKVDVAGVGAGHKAVVAHIVNGQVELIGATAHDGFITFAVSSFSPFAVFVDKTASGAGTTASSPSTGVYA